ncbi:MAG TPA: LysR family transcriptional regulator, partial [Bacillota bacterium]|nr:LysR family transcriptional regulator [Bacillota bacterium]
MLEVRHLHYFKAVAEHLNFTKAAQSVNMSQPPLSYQIKQLEKYLGVDLFYRTNRSVKLTKAGKYFYDVTVKTLNNFESQVEMVKKIGEGKIGNLRLG